MWFRVELIQSKIALRRWKLTKRCFSFSFSLGFNFLDGSIRGGDFCLQSHVLSGTNQLLGVMPSMIFSTSLKRERPQREREREWGGGMMGHNRFIIIHTIFKLVDFFNGCLWMRLLSSIPVYVKRASGWGWLPLHLPCISTDPKIN